MQRLPNQRSNSNNSSLNTHSLPRVRSAMESKKIKFFAASIVTAATCLVPAMLSNAAANAAMVRASGTPMTTTQQAHPQTRSAAPTNHPSNRSTNPNHSGQARQSAVHRNNCANQNNSTNRNGNHASNTNCVNRTSSNGHNNTNRAANANRAAATHRSSAAPQSH